MWDPERQAVVVSPNVDFGELISTTPSLTDPIQHLRELKDAFDAQLSGKDSLAIEPDRQPRSTDGNASEWESDEEIL